VDVNGILSLGGMPITDESTTEDAKAAHKRLLRIVKSNQEAVDFIIKMLVVYWPEKWEQKYLSEEDRLFA
jgi:hypothetical protein